MTTRQTSSQISSMITLLRKLDISEQDCIRAEQYLNGDVGDEVLDQFEQKDLSGISRQLSDEANKITDQITKVKGKEKRTCACAFSMWYTRSAMLPAGACSGTMRWIAPRNMNCTSG